MVSFTEIIKKLMGGSYSTGFGYPESDRDMEEFVRRVKARVPELRHEEDWKVEETVNQAIEWILNTHCKPLDHKVKQHVNYLKEGGLFECYHPSIGKFYLAFAEEQDGDAGVWHFGFILTRDKREAKEWWELSKPEFEEEEEEY